MSENGYAEANMSLRGSLEDFVKESQSIDLDDDQIIDDVMDMLFDLGVRGDN